MGPKRDILNCIHPDSQMHDPCANCGHMSCEHKVSVEEDKTHCLPLHGELCNCTNFEKKPHFTEKIIPIRIQNKRKNPMYERATVHILDGSGLAWYYEREGMYDPVHVKSGIALFCPFSTQEHIEKFLLAIAPLTDWNQSYQDLVNAPNHQDVRKKCCEIAKALKSQERGNSCR
jgi:hypothetical protein